VTILLEVPKDVLDSAIHPKSAAATGADRIWPSCGDAISVQRLRLCRVCRIQQHRVAVLTLWKPVASIARSF
jgi:hypothetical protein